MAASGEFSMDVDALVANVPKLLLMVWKAEEASFCDEGGGGGGGGTAPPAPGDGIILVGAGLLLLLL